jgi:hypothetical protein
MSTDADLTAKSHDSASDFNFFSNTNKGSRKKSSEVSSKPAYYKSSKLSLRNWSSLKNSIKSDGTDEKLMSSPKKTTKAEFFAQYSTWENK